MTETAEISVRKAVAAKLASIDAAMKMAQVGVKFDPPSDPDEAYYILEWEIVTTNPTMGDGLFRLEGMLTVTLNYPEGMGPKDAHDRAGLIRTSFKRGLPLSADGVTTTIQRTAEIGKEWASGGRYFLPVTLRFFANAIGG